ncbi:MAG: hypothetical protein MR971_00430 [Bacteroidales bacterium]|nr:hypothetical protein [Bacteroidales bacterium]
MSEERKTKLKDLFFALPNRSLSYQKIVQGERRTKRKAVQSERKGKIKNVSLYIAFSELQPAL